MVASVGTLRAILCRGVFALVLPFSIFMASWPACAQYERLGFGQFKHTRWTADDGIPNGIFEIAQTPDGFLWLAADSGLYRFDGVTAERIPVPRGSPMAFSKPLSLLVRRSGELWVGYSDSGGIAAYRKGRLIDLAMAKPPPSVDTMVEGQDGIVWVAWSGHSGPERRLRRFLGGRWELVADRLSLPDGMISNMTVGPDGTLWIALGWNTTGTVARLEPGASRFRDSGYKVSGFPYVASDLKGRVWVWDDEGLAVLSDLKGKAPDRAARFRNVPRARYPSLAFDTRGDIWGTTGTAGIFTKSAADSHEMQSKANEEGLRRFDAKLGLTSDEVSSIFVDREGSVWVGGFEGLDQFRVASVWREPLIPFNPADGAAIAQGREGSVYIATSGGLFLVAAGEAPRPIMHSRDLWTMCPAHDRGIWAILPDRILHIVGNERSNALKMPANTEQVASCAEDRLGRLWLMLGSLTLIWHDTSGWHQATDGNQESTKRTYWELVASPQGDIAFTQGSSLVRLDGTTRTQADLAALKLGTFSTYAAGRHDLFIAGRGGLARLRNRKSRLISADRYPWIGGLKGVLETSHGQTWLVGDDAISVVTTADLHRAFESPEAQLKRRRFDTRDGLASAPVNGVVGPVAAVGGDGRAWLLTQSGVFFVDPARLSRNLVQPGVAIRWLAAGGASYRDPDKVVLPPGTRSLDVAYAALSLVVPQRVAFRYRLDGVDNDWVDPGSRRLASYSNLGPGRYRFRVIAANNDGVWNTTGATLDLEIGPTFVQSLPFKLLCALLLLGLLWLAYSLRLRAVANRIRMRMAERIAERERIARDLHDTLLQSVQALTLRFQLVVDELPVAERARPALEAAIDRADQVIAEGRDRVKELRSPQDGNDIAQVVSDLIAQQGFDSSVAVAIETVGNPRALDPLAADEIARIAGEAIFNIRRHAQASRIAVEIRFGASFALCVVDNGVGIDTAIVARGGREGHYGMTGMRERASKLDGDLIVRRIAEGGTQVVLTVPGRIAYRARRPRWLSRWWKR